MMLIMMKVISESIIDIKCLAWHIKFDKRKALKKDINEELIFVAWHPKRWWKFCMSKDKKKEIEPII